MLRWNRLIVPVAGLAMVLGFAQARSRAADPVPAAEGKANVTVTVVDGDGKPVVGANVSLVVATGKKKAELADPATTAPTTPPERPVPVATGTTDDTGKAVLSKVPDGKYRVRARMKKAGSGTETVTIEDGKDATVSVTLKPRTPKTK